MNVKALVFIVHLIFFGMDQVFISDLTQNINTKISSRIILIIIQNGQHWHLRNAKRFNVILMQYSIIEICTDKYKVNFSDRYFCDECQYKLQTCDKCGNDNVWIHDVICDKCNWCKLCGKCDECGEIACWCNGYVCEDHECNQRLCKECRVTIYCTSCERHIVTIHASCPYYRKWMQKQKCIGCRWSMPLL